MRVCGWGWFPFSIAHFFRPGFSFPSVKVWKGFKVMVLQSEVEVVIGLLFTLSWEKKKTKDFIGKGFVGNGG